MQTLQTWLGFPWMRTLIGCALLILVAWLAALLARRVLVRGVKAISRRTAWSWDDALLRRGVFLRLAQVVPMLILRFGIDAVPGIADSAVRAVSAIAMALTVLFVLLATSAALSAFEDLYQETPHGRERSIKGYVQLLKIVLFMIGAIVIIAVLVDRSALSLLAGLGAVSAVILLIFKDTLMSVVASVQIASYDMLRVGDWIALPDDNVDGDVIEISLNTVKVVNWDKTVSTIPTWHLISRSYRNYRNMYETGRRIRRALNIDITSVRHHTPGEIDHLQRFTLLDDYFRHKKADLDAWNADLGRQGVDAVNRRRLTNMGSFRAYVQTYIGSHPGINQDLFWAVRQLDPTATGIPLQVYAYTRDTGFVAHENVQGDIFDHLIAILPQFGLRLFQQPSGADWRHAAFGNTDADAQRRGGGPAKQPQGLRAGTPG